MIFPWKGQRSDSKIDQPHVLGHMFLPFLRILLKSWKNSFRNELFVTLIYLFTPQH